MVNRGPSPDAVDLHTDSSVFLLSVPGLVRRVGRVVNQDLPFKKKKKSLPLLHLRLNGLVPGK